MFSMQLWLVVDVWPSSPCLHSSCKSQRHRFPCQRSGFPPPRRLCLVPIQPRPAQPKTAAAKCSRSRSLMMHCCCAICVEEALTGGQTLHITPLMDKTWHITVFTYFRVFFLCFCCHSLMHVLKDSSSFIFKDPLEKWTVLYLSLEPIRR